MPFDSEHIRAFKALNGVDAKRYREGLDGFFEEAKDAGALGAVFDDLLADPKGWLYKIDIPDVSGTCHLFPNLTECVCGFSDRFKTELRKSTEDSIHDFVGRRFTDKAEAIHYLSFGGGGTAVADWKNGGLLQDFLIIAKLIQAGFTHIEIDLVDPLLVVGGKVSKAYPVFVKWLEAYAKEKSGELKIKQAFASVQDYRSHPEFRAPDIIAAIDLEDLASDKTKPLIDLMAVHRLLAPRGMMFLSVKDNLFQFPPAPMAVAAAVVSEDSSVKTNLNIASLLPEDIWAYLTQLLPAYMERHAGLRQITLSLSLPISSESRISQNDLQYFASLLFPHIRVSVRVFPNSHGGEGYYYVRDTPVKDVVERACSLREKSQDFIFCRGSIAGDPGGTVEAVLTCVKAIHEHAPAAEKQFSFRNLGFEFAWCVSGASSGTSRVVIRMLSGARGEDEASVAQALLMQFYKKQFPAYEIIPLRFEQSFENFPQTGMLFMKFKNKVLANLDDDFDGAGKVEKFNKFIADIKAALFKTKSATERAEEIDSIAKNVHYLGNPAVKISWTSKTAATIAIVSNNLSTLFGGSVRPEKPSLDTIVRSILEELKVALVAESSSHSAAPTPAFAGAGAGRA